MGSEDEVERPFIPSRGYDFQLTIDGNDYSNDIMAVDIFSSIELPYISVLMTMFIDPNDIVLNQIYGQSPIKLSIRHIGQVHARIPDEQLDLELMYISSDFDITMKNAMSSQVRMKDRSAVQVTMVCKEPFKIMNTHVNGVYIGKTVKQVIDDLANRVNATVQADTNGINTQVIDQILIPPMTLYQALKYLNKTFGIYNGISSFYCIEDKPKSRLFIKNLTSKGISGNVAAIWQLAAGTSNEVALDPSTLADAGGQSYYTYKEVETQYKGNTSFSIYGPKMIHIVKPGNKLYSRIEITTEDFVKQYGLLFTGRQLYYDKQTLRPESRISWFKDHTGYEETQTHINANWGKLFSDLSTLVVSLEKNVFLLPLLNVGESAMFTSLIDNMKDFGGKYILASTEMSFSRAEREFTTNVKITLIRSNRTLE